MCIPNFYMCIHRIFPCIYLFVFSNMCIVNLTGICTCAYRGAFVYVYMYTHVYIHLCLYAFFILQDMCMTDVVGMYVCVCLCVCSCRYV